MGNWQPKFFIPASSDINGAVSEIMTEVARQTEESLIGQLNDFISRGLITVERTQPLFVQEPGSANLVLRYSVHLKLKDAEYIESLERQIKELNDLVAKLRSKQP